MKNIVVCIIILLILLFYLSYIRNKNSRVLKSSYESIIGYNNDDNAQSVIHAGRKISNPTSLEQYRMGDILLNNLNQPHIAGDEYLHALNNIYENPQEEYNLFVLDHIEGDYERFGQQLTPYNLNAQFPQLRAHVIHHINNEVDVADRVDISMSNKNKDERKQAIFKNKNNWVYEAHSVHDSAVNKKLREHFDKIKDYNAQEYGPLTDESATKALSELTTYIQSQPDNNAALDVINISQQGLRVVNLGTEHEVLVEVWRRINSTSNAARQDELRESLKTFMDICKQDGNLVCTGGRVTYLIQSLTHNDVDENLGNMETEQSIRNRIYGDASKILNKHIETLTDKDKEIYNKSESNDKIVQMESDAKKDITSMVTNTEDISDNHKQNLIEECVAVI